MTTHKYGKKYGVETGNAANAQGKVEISKINIYFFNISI